MIMLPVFFLVPILAQPIPQSKRQFFPSPQEHVANEQTPDGPIEMWGGFALAFLLFFVLCDLEVAAINALCGRPVLNFIIFDALSNLFVWRGGSHDG